MILWLKTPYFLLLNAKTLAFETWNKYKSMLFKLLIIYLLVIYHPYLIVINPRIIYRSFYLIC